MQCPKCGKRENAVQESRMKELRGTTTVFPHRSRKCFICHHKWWSVELPLDCIESAREHKD